MLVIGNKQLSCLLLTWCATPCYIKKTFTYEERKLKFDRHLVQNYPMKNPINSRILDLNDSNCPTYVSFDVWLGLVGWKE